MAKRKTWAHRLFETSYDDPFDYEVNDFSYPYFPADILNGKQIYRNRDNNDIDLYLDYAVEEKKLRFSEGETYQQYIQWIHDTCRKPYFHAFRDEAQGHHCSIVFTRESDWLAHKLRWT